MIKLLMLNPKDINPKEQVELAGEVRTYLGPVEGLLPYPSLCKNILGDLHKSQKSLIDNFYEHVNKLCDLGLLNDCHKYKEKPSRYNNGQTFQTKVFHKSNGNTEPVLRPGGPVKVKKTKEPIIADTLPLGPEILQQLRRIEEKLDIILAKE